MTSTIDGTIHVLRAMAVSEPDLTPTVSVVGDIARLLRQPDTGDLAEVAAAVAEVRERLEFGDDVEHTPLRSLRGDKAHAFAGGALWACSDMIDAFLRSSRAAEERTRVASARAHVRATARQLGRAHVVFTPSDVRDALSKEGREVSPDTVSRGLADLLAVGELELATPPTGASRRNRFYQLAGARPDGNENIEDARRCLEELILSVGSSDARSFGRRAGRR